MHGRGVGSHGQIRHHWGVLVGPQGGQRLLDVEFPGQDPQEGKCGQVLPVDLETETPVLVDQESVEGHQEELEEIQRPVQCQGQDEAEQGQQGAGGQEAEDDGGVLCLEGKEGQGV